MSEERSKICIVTTRNIFDAPCLAKYQSLIDCPFDIIYWDRCGVTENCGAENYFRFHKEIPMNAGKLQKLKAYFQFSRFVNRILAKSNYSRLIVFPTQMGWLIQKKLSKRYKGRYIFDIRDYAGENNPLISRMTKKVISNAGLCSITSPAYKKFLPKGEYLVSHNVQPIAGELVERYRARVRDVKNPIVLSFIGTVRFIEQQKKLIKLFKNDMRFHLKYIGRGSEQLDEFCKSEQVSNVTLIGRFDRERLPEFYMDTDMAINVYGNHDPYLDYALSNKLYSAATMGMPILVSPGTYMAELVEKYGIGIAVHDDSNETPDVVYSFCNNLISSQLFERCDSFMKKVSEQENKYSNDVVNFLKNCC